MQAFCPRIVTLEYSQQRYKIYVVRTVQAADDCPLRPCRCARPRRVCRAGTETPLLRHLSIKAINLPRQARDKHRESTQKRVAFP